MANHIEFRWVEIREPAEGGGFRTKSTKLQYRTKDVITVLLGLIPLSSSWTAWTDITTDVVLLDDAGNPSS